MDLSTALDAPPSSAVWAVRLTVALSALTVVFLLFVAAGGSISEALPPKPSLVSCAIVAAVLAFFVLKRQNWARVALAILASTTGLIGLAYAFSTTGLVLALVVPWLLGGAAVTVLLIVPETIDWIRSQPTQPVAG